MNKIVQYLGLDVHKESIAVSIAPQTSTEVRRYGIISGTLNAVDKLIQSLSPNPAWSCALFTKPARRGRRHGRGARAGGFPLGHCLPGQAGRARGGGTID